MDNQAENGFKMTVKTFHGLEEVLATEIREIGGKDIQILNRAVSFFGDKKLLYKANLYLRTAIRILIPLIETDIRNQIDLYNRIREYEWEQHIKTGMTMAVDSFVHSTTFSNSHFVSLRTKDAIVDRFKDKFGKRPSINKIKPDAFINVHLAGNRLTVSLDTSGASLHKRGYRKADGPAPLNEALAAGMILLAGWKGETDFYDPMCGSGTLGIEAALIARNIPPGIFRQEYGFEKSPDFDADLLEEVFESAEEKNWDGKIFSSDISKPAIQAAMKNAREASVNKNINFRGVNFLGYPPVTDPSLAILNPPYGQRILQPEIVNFYKAIGDTLKKSFTGSKVWIISGNLEALKYVGLKPSRKQILFNGQLECGYHRFDIYPGSKKAKFQQQKS